MSAATHPVAAIGDRQPVLHNSGPGPVAVYRTAAAGSLHLLDLYTEVHASPLITPALRRRFTPIAPHYHQRNPVPVIIPAAHATPSDVVELVQQLTAGLGGNADAPRPRRQSSAPTTADAHAAIDALRQQLEAAGALTPFVGLVSWVRRDDCRATPFRDAIPPAPMPWLTKDAAARDSLRLAWLAVAVSTLAEPLLLLTRPPSLRYWRPDGGLSARWFGTPESIT